LVVNADAEQIIVAKNEDEILSYQSGSLEDTKLDDVSGIREMVYGILEGGKEAFEKRENEQRVKSCNI